jgi:hypothetical protein
MCYYHSHYDAPKYIGVDDTVIHFGSPNAIVVGYPNSDDRT